MIRLKYVSSINEEVLEEDTDPAFEFLYADISAVGQGSLALPGELTRFGSAPSRARRLATAGDTVVSTVRTYLRAVTEVPETEDTLVFSTGFAVVSPNQDLVYPRFLTWQLQGDDFISTVESISTGVSYPATSASAIGDIAVRIPPLDIQRAVAALLDRETAKIDALIAKQDALVARLREHHRSAIAQAVESVLDPESGARFKHFVTEMRQGWSPQCEAVPSDGVTEWGVLKTGCVNGGVFRPGENKLLPGDVDPRPETVVRRGEIVISRASTRDLVGSAALVEDEYPRLMLSDKTYAITVDRRVADPRFVSLLLGTARSRQAIERDATGASYSMQNVSKEDLLNLPMPLPPVGSQFEVARALQVDAPKVDAMVDKAQRLSAKLKERRAALITAAVTGRLDVTTYGKAG